MEEEDEEEKRRRRRRRSVRKVSYSWPRCTSGAWCTRRGRASMHQHSRDDDTTAQGGDSRGACKGPAPPQRRPPRGPRPTRAPPA
eukprot:2874746-Pyramimonas_sp.AAC.1